jgi:DNA-binding NtrC family response regulator
MARILVVEDDPTIRRAMTVSLALDNHDVEAAADLPHGVELLQRQGCDLVVTDLFSPTFSPDALRALDPLIRAAPETPIVVTTVDDQAATLRPASYGLAAILLKPFRVDALRACVQTALVRAEATLLLREAYALHRLLATSPAHPGDLTSTNRLLQRVRAVGQELRDLSAAAATVRPKDRATHC